MTSPEENQPVNLSYHWLEGQTTMPEKQGKVVVMDGRRTVLPHDIQPGETVTLNAQVQAPDREGNFTLQVTMVKEHVAWFENRGAQPLDIPVEVTAR